ncbi:hypothetical protein GD3902_05455 [Geobacillus thermodenitrificans]|mgnify:FL=1|jgi:hypothetical protein|nr:hypothetical protein GD3902_05455 [Geobacillus thermodenitrificans]
MLNAILTVVFLRRKHLGVVVHFLLLAVAVALALRGIMFDFIDVQASESIFFLLGKAGISVKSGMRSLLVEIAKLSRRYEPWEARHSKLRGGSVAFVLPY